MNGAHLHLIFNHVPVILAPAGLVVLALGLLRRNVEFAKVGLGVIVAAALFTVPTYVSGDGAAEIVSDLPGVTSEAIERHDEMAGLAFAAIGLAGVAALAALVLGARGKVTPKWLTIVALILALAASTVLGVTANLGGQIRHTEILAAEADKH
jgi:uncharacterized membrane protein